MADKKVSAFDAAATLDGTEVVDGVQAGGNVKITTQAIADLGSGGAAPEGTSALIASAIGVDLNTGGDTTTTLSAFATGKFFVVDYVLFTNSDADLSAEILQVSVWSGAGGTGQQYAAVNVFFIVNPRDWSTSHGSSINSTISGGSDSHGTMQNTAPIINVGTPQGAAATADFHVFGRVFT